MSTALKDLYSKAFVAEISGIIKPHIKNFDEVVFAASIFDKNWKNLELKQRMRHITNMLNRVLPEDFERASKVLFKITSGIQQHHGNGMHFLYMFLPEYVEQFGINHFDTSVALFEKITQVTSAEFAVRPFIIKYPKPMMQQMVAWSKHQSEYVRRLSSEGARPRLPWAIGLPAFKKDPSPVLPILENLKNDASETVRRSVANNLNDIAKDHPETVLRLINKWQGKSKNTDWIIKHGSRTLLKQGNDEAMRIFGNHPIKSFTIQKIRSDKQVKIGGTYQFQFEYLHAEKQAVDVRMDYAIYYVKSTGKVSKKVFRLTEGKTHPNKLFTLTKKQHFKDLTTRKHYAGEHQLAIIVNGNEIVRWKFKVIG